MFLYGNTGLNLPSHVKNQSPSFPAIKLQENAAQGLGFFTSRGVAEDVDTNVSTTDSSKFLRNLPTAKRCDGYIAVLMSVEADEATGPFVQSSNPSVYIYKGGVNILNVVTDEAWTLDTNWIMIQGSSDPGGDGNIAQQIEGVTQQTTSTINFVDVANVTEITFTDDANDDLNDAFKFDIASDFARSDQNFYLGGKATAFASGDSIGAANGVQILSEGSMVFKKDGISGTTNIAGGTVSLTNINASSNIETSAVFRAGSFAGQNSTLSSTQLSTDRVVASTKITAPVIEAAPSGDIKFNIPGSLQPAFAITTSNDFTPTGPSSTSEAGVSQVYVNASLRLLETPNNPTEIEFLYGVGPDGQVSKIAKNLVATGASAFQQGFGITITNQDSDNPGIQINQADVVTTSTSQTIAASKEIGQVVLTGTISSSDSNIDGLKFNESAIDNISDQSEAAENINLLYVINNQASNRHGTVYRGVSGSAFLNKHLELSTGLRSNLNTETDKLTLGITDIYVKNNANDASVYDFRSKRFGVHSFTPSEIASDLNAHGNTENTAAHQAAVSEGATIIEWVREFGDYVNGSAADIAARRSSGVIVKSGFTHTSNPYTSQGILDTRFRFAVKAAGENELTSQSEELSGQVSFQVPATDTTYTGTDAPWAIQIGTHSSSSSDVGLRRNEVSIPNLLVKNLTVPNNGSSYIGGGGTFGGDWTFNGAVTINGVLTATNADNSLGSTSTGTLATTASLLQLGSPSADAVGNFGEREIGIVGLFNYTGGGDGSVDNNEAQATSFFRDHSESGIAEIYGRSASPIGSTDNHHKPWKLMTSAEKVNTIGTAIDTTDDFYPTALEVGGIRLSGYDPATPTGYSTKFFNRVVTDISGVHDTEDSVSAEAWAGGGTALSGALASAKAIKDYVDTAVGDAGGFTVSDLTVGTFDFGFSGADEVATSTNAYTAANADRILLQDVDDSDNTKSALPQDIGLALYEDSSESSGNVTRPNVGWLPGSRPLGTGTSLRSIMNQVFTLPDIPEIEQYDMVPTASGSNSIFLTAVHANHRYSPPGNISYSIFEHGYNDFGDDAQNNIDADFSGTNGVILRLTEYLGVQEFRHKVTLGPGLSITDVDGGSVQSSDINLIGLSPSTAPLIETTLPSGDDLIYFLNLADGGANSANKVLKHGGEVDLSASTAQSTLKFEARISALTDQFAGYTSPNPVRLFTYFVRRRSFMFVSDLDIRNSVRGAAGTDIVDNGLDFPIQGSFAKIDGTKAAAQTDSSYSNKFMHYLIATANSATDSVIGSADIVEDVNGTDITFGAGLLSSTSNITNVKIRNVISAQAGGAANTPLSSTSTIHLPHIPNSSSIQKYPGMLSELKGVIGGNQYWPRSVSTTSPDGYLYRAVPISFAGGGIASSWLSGGDAKFKIETEFGNADELVRDGDGNLLTFHITNQYGVETEYVLFQSAQPLDGAASVGKFGDIVEI